MLVFKVEAECKFQFLQITIWIVWIPDKFWNSNFQCPFYNGFLDQQAIVWCDSVI